jgi:GH25 family lysozyme M1 (1,4-beta-N-acetylmuramidase)
MMTNTVSVAGKFWGPDVSKWRPIKDWGALVASGAQFLGAKACEGVLTTDPTFKSVRDGFRAHPEFKLGVYYSFIHFEKSPESLAELLIKLVGTLDPRERLCVDFESKSYDGIEPFTVKRHGLEYLDRFFDTLERSGVLNGSRPFMYTSFRHWLAMGDPSWERAETMDLWVPRYHSPNPLPPDRLPVPWSDWTIFQWTDGGGPGSTGLYHDVPGIGCCDVNFVKG